jgi:hypothetical protein
MLAPIIQSMVEEKNVNFAAKSSWTQNVTKILAACDQSNKNGILKL